MRAGTVESPQMGMSYAFEETGGDVVRFEWRIHPGAPEVPLHVHPRQEERLEVISGRIRSRSGGVERLLGPGESVVSPPGEAHTAGVADSGEAVVMAELRPALRYREFLEAIATLDRDGRIDARGRGSLRAIARRARPHEAEFFQTGVPVAVQRAVMRLLAGRRPGP